MPIDPWTVVDLGREIGNAYDTEVGKRSAVSRIYYGVFLEVRERFPVRTRERRVHQAVSASLARATKKQFGDQLKDLRELRESADYELDASDWDRNLLRANRLADQIGGELRRRFGR